MDSTSPRTARLQALHERWFTDPLGIQFPDMGEFPAPNTCDELVRGPRVASSFSSLADAPDAVGLTLEAAAEADRQANADRYRVEDPKALMAELSGEVAKVPTGFLKPEVLKQAFVVLDEIRADSLELAAAADGDVQANHLAEAAALAKAQKALGDIAAELGISIPITRGVNPDGKD